MKNSFIDNFNKMGKAISELVNALADSFSKAFSNAWQTLTKINLDKKLSKKKFIKLLMSKGIQRNEANKIACEIHKKYGKYTVRDLLLAIKKKI